MEKRYKSVFDIIGPVMVGPSSSHTAGAVAIGHEGNRLFGGVPKLLFIIMALLRKRTADMVLTMPSLQESWALLQRICVCREHLRLRANAESIFALLKNKAKAPSATLTLRFWTCQMVKRRPNYQAALSVAVPSKCARSSYTASTSSQLVLYQS